MSQPKVRYMVRYRVKLPSNRFEWRTEQVELDRTASWNTLILHVQSVLADKVFPLQYDAYDIYEATHMHSWRAPDVSL